MYYLLKKCGIYQVSNLSKVGTKLFIQLGLDHRPPLFHKCWTVYSENCLFEMEEVGVHQYWTTGKEVDDHINTIYFCRFSYLLLSIFYLKIIVSFEIMRSSETTNYTFFITKQLCLLKYNLDYIQQHAWGRSWFNKNYHQIHQNLKTKK